MGHHHHHHADTSSRRIGMAFWLNFCFTIIEFIGGILTNSTAIIADAVHDLGDSLSLGLAWVLNKLGAKKATTGFTYGFKRFSLLGALINAMVLLAGSAWVLYETIPRLSNPVMPNTEGMIYLAVLGVVVNGFAAFKLSAGESLNERVLNWHLLEDVLGWVAVLIGAIVMSWVDWPIIDPLLSLVFTAFILINVVRALVETLKLFSQANPNPALFADVVEAIRAVDHVVDVHHIHLWTLDGESHVLTAHVELDDDFADSDHYLEIKREINAAIARFEIFHTTIELEFKSEACRIEPGAEEGHQHAKRT
ncbi:cation diffusion facilitator family transporter [Pseudidiomarina insulisalsae]|uniref:Cation transporter n=1 Tax=Pseudidiomarina insulisalsae TaxID=575789 RepID=A0A432YMA4_9GAMM|nr:cation diffusion facilitator family transporter [Pseudidiomarina insulisalsae]RUO62080.1 cation transporter [Pseudidiomarina insulisalsae]